MDSDLFSLMLDTGLIKQNRELSVDHKPGVNVSSLLQLSAEGDHEADPERDLEPNPAGHSVSCKWTVLESKSLLPDYNLLQSSSSPSL